MCLRSHVPIGVSTQISAIQQDVYIIPILFSCSFSWLVFFVCVDFLHFSDFLFRLAIPFLFLEHFCLDFIMFEHWIELLIIRISFGNVFGVFFALTIRFVSGWTKITATTMSYIWVEIKEGKE